MRELGEMASTQARAGGISQDAKTLQQQLTRCRRQYSSTECHSSSHPALTSKVAAPSLGSRVRRKLDSRLGATDLMYMAYVCRCSFTNSSDCGDGERGDEMRSLSLAVHPIHSCPNQA